MRLRKSSFVLTFQAVYASDILDLFGTHLFEKCMRLCYKTLFYLVKALLLLFFPLLLILLLLFFPLLLMLLLLRFPFLLARLLGIVPGSQLHEQLLSCALLDF